MISEMQPVEVHFSGKYFVRDCVNLGPHFPIIGRRNSNSNMIPLKYPNKIPIILERAASEKHLADLERKRFLVPEDLTLIHFQSIIRKRLKLQPERALFFLINGASIVSLSKQMQEIYAEYKSQDNCLYITYASEDCFG